MWKTKYFETEKKAREFIIAHQFFYMTNLIFIENGYGVEYKKLKQL